MAGLGWAPRQQGPSPRAKVPPVPGRECGVLGRTLESKGETGKMESELERDLEGGRVDETQGKDKISETKSGGHRQ